MSQRGRGSQKERKTDNGGSKRVKKTEVKRKRDLKDYLLRSDDKRKSSTIIREQDNGMHVIIENLENNVVREDSIARLRGEGDVDDIFIDGILKEDSDDTDGITELGCKRMMNDDENSNDGEMGSKSHLRGGDMNDEASSSLQEDECDAVFDLNKTQPKPASDTESSFGMDITSSDERLRLLEFERMQEATRKAAETGIPLEIPKLRRLVISASEGNVFRMERKSDEITAQERLASENDALKTLSHEISKSKSSGILYSGRSASKSQSQRSSQSQTQSKSEQRTRSRKLSMKSADNNLKNEKSANKDVKRPTEQISHADRDQNVTQSYVESSGDKLHSSVDNVCDDIYYTSRSQSSYVDIRALRRARIFDCWPRNARRKTIKCIPLRRMRRVRGFGVKRGERHNIVHDTSTTSSLSDYDENKLLFRSNKSVTQENSMELSSNDSLYVPGAVTKMHIADYDHFYLFRRLIKKVFKLNEDNYDAVYFSRKLRDYHEDPNFTTLHRMTKDLKIFDHCLHTKNGFTFYEYSQWEVNKNDQYFRMALAMQLEREILSCTEHHLEELDNQERRLWTSFAGSFYTDKLMKRYIGYIKYRYSNNTEHVKRMFENDLTGYLPFNSGILDFTTPHPISIDPRYKNQAVIDHSPRLGFEYDALNKYLKDMFPDEKEREYALYNISLLFTSKIDVNNVMFFVGPVSSGKSTLLWLLRACFSVFGCLKDQNWLQSVNRNTNIRDLNQGSVESKIIFIDNVDPGIVTTDLVANYLKCDLKKKWLVVFTDNIPSMKKSKIEPEFVDRIRFVLLNTKFSDDARHSHQRKKKANMLNEIKRYRKDWLDGIYSLMYKECCKFEKSMPPYIPDTYPDIDLLADKNFSYDDVLVKYIETNVHKCEQGGFFWSLKMRPLYKAFNNYLRNSRDKFPKEYRDADYCHFFNVAKCTIKKRFEVKMVDFADDSDFHEEFRSKEKDKGFCNVYLKED